MMTGSSFRYTQAREYKVSLLGAPPLRCFASSNLRTQFVRHSIAAGDPRVRSRSDLLMFLHREFETFPDAQETILDIFAEGEKVAVRHQFSGTQRGAMGSYPSTGKIMNAEYIAIYRVRNGQIIEAWAEWDNLAGLRQLGHL